METHDRLILIKPVNKIRPGAILAIKKDGETIHAIYNKTKFTKGWIDLALKSGLAKYYSGPHYG